MLARDQETLHRMEGLLAKLKGTLKDTQTSRKKISAVQLDIVVFKRLVKVYAGSTQTMAQRYSVTTEKGWSWILGPDGYKEGPVRYRWEAEEWAEEMNNGKPPPAEMRAIGEAEKR